MGWRALAATGSRRRVLAAALAGGLFAALGGRRAGGSDERVKICHKTTADTNQVVLIEVSANAVPDHVAHGDFRYAGCCLDGDCGAGQACVDGSCEGACRGPAAFCETNDDCCAPLCCDIARPGEAGVCDNDCGFD